VARDAARRHGVVLVLVVLVAGWLERAWPAAEVRAAAWSASDEARGLAASPVHFAWSVATGGAASQIVLSRRLELFRSLPRTAWWWRRFHALHLIALDALVLVVTAYGVAPMSTASALGWVVCMLGLSLGLRTLAIVARGPLSVVAGVVHVVLVAVVIAHATAGSAALVAGVLAAGAVFRLGRPLPEPGDHGRSWRRGATRIVGSGLAGLHLRAWLRLRPLAAAAVAVASSVLAWLAGVGWEHVAHDEPDAAASLVRGVAWCIAALSSVALPMSRSLVAADLGHMDAWPVSSSSSAWALVRIAAAPALFGVVVLSLGPVPWTRALPPMAAAVVACAVACVATHARNTAARGDARRFAIRWTAICGVGAVVAVVAWPALWVWALFEAVRLPSIIARADAARRRFSRDATERDHGG
jgi:hypothetical protein